MEIGTLVTAQLLEDSLEWILYKELCDPKDAGYYRTAICRICTKEDAHERSDEGDYFEIIRDNLTQDELTYLVENPKKIFIEREDVVNRWLTVLDMEQP